MVAKTGAGVILRTFEIIAGRFGFQGVDMPNAGFPGDLVSYQELEIVPTLTLAGVFFRNLGITLNDVLARTASLPRSSRFIHLASCKAASFTAQ